MQSPKTSLACPACKQGLAPSQLLDACDTYWSALDVVNFTCPHCNATSEAQLRPGAIHLGYSYAAGTVHFCAMLEHEVPGLELYASAEQLNVELGSLRWTIRSVVQHRK
jgi:hypothetical protein